MPSGERPMKSVANQFTIQTTYAPMPHTSRKSRCGITSRMRKKTVRRLRLRSSSTTR